MMKINKNTILSDKYSNILFVISILITVFLISILVWNLAYSHRLVESFEEKELSIQKASGDILLYSEALKMTAYMATASGDLRWKNPYEENLNRINEVLEKIPQLIETEEAIESINRIKYYIGEINQIEEQTFELVSRGRKNEAERILSGWEYTKNQLNLADEIKNLVPSMHSHIKEEIESRKNLNSNIFLIVSACFVFLIISWFATFRNWKINKEIKNKKEEKIKYLSYHDSLTGMYNRTYYDEAIKRLNNEEMQPLTILIGDVNGLKITNDIFGHAKGDELLIETARILKESVRKDDIIARWGGDEFIIVLPRTNKKLAEGIIKRIQEKCEKSNFKPIPPYIAFGFAVKTSSNQNIDHIFNSAENKMYHRKKEQKKGINNPLLKKLITSIECKDSNNINHTSKIQNLAKGTAKALSFNKRKSNDLVLLTRIHDIGKLAIPDYILNKNDYLNSNEWEEYKRHVEVGYEIASSFQMLEKISPYLLHHHERWDGLGYPYGLKGENIPLFSRIIHIIDLYDALTSDMYYPIDNLTFYKKPLSKEEAINKLQDYSGSMLDPKLVNIFVNDVL